LIKIRAEVRKIKVEYAYSEDKNAQK